MFSLVFIILSYREYNDIHLFKGDNNMLTSHPLKLCTNFLYPVTVPTNCGQPELISCSKLQQQENLNKVHMSVVDKMYKRCFSLMSLLDFSR